MSSHISYYLGGTKGAPVDLITLKEAAQMLGVSRDTLRKLVNRGVFTVYANPSDAREKLIERTAIEEYMRPRVIRERAIDYNVEKEP